ncbi:MAG TPA: serine/threonine-protein kinase [Vicinamibacteria bacterium]|nr:serine/threonine-protein kinase [Vicinamibacteria bacterium]
MLPADLPEKAARRKIGKYAVVGRIGRGGMGMVYRGWDEVLEREVAVKTLTVEGTLDQESRQRFQIEARAAARLQHANIVTVFELGEDRGLPFIAMELLPGVDLETLMRSGEPLLLEEKLEIMVQVLRGLHFAHEHGIVHRDIKPSNIRLLEDGTAKIMDFGIAKLGGMGLTKTGMMVGTVHYMSPEQIRGKKLDGRSDVFSSGVILYELLCGKRPFVGDSPTAVLYKIINDPPETLDPSVAGAAPELQAVLDRALAKDSEARYSTAALMGEELAAVAVRLRGPSSAPPPDVLEAVSVARRLVKEGKVDDALHRLQDVTQRHPRSIEARRALRTAARERERRLKPREPEAQDFPELDATYQGSPTRRTPDTVLQASDPVPGTVLLAPAARTPATSSARTLLLTAAAALLVVVVAGVLLMTRRPPVAAAVVLHVGSEPTGAQVFLDGRETGVVTDGDVTLPAGASGAVTLTLRKAAYREATRVLRLPLGLSEVRFTLEALPIAATAVALPVVTDPAGASVTVDSEAVKGTTPLTVSIDPAREHRIMVRLEGHAPQEVRVAAGAATAPVRLTLEAAGPLGRIAVSAPYPLDVVWRGKVLSHGQPSPEVSVPAGRQVLALVAPTYFLRQNVTVDVRPPAVATVAAPALGKINIRANPDNCQVFIDGDFVEYPPILDRAIAAGDHRVAFKWPDGARREESVQVARGAPAYVMGRKD